MKILKTESISSDSPSIFDKRVNEFTLQKSGHVKSIEVKILQRVWNDSPEGSYPVFCAIIVYQEEI